MESQADVADMTYGSIFTLKLMRPRLTAAYRNLNGT
jgi:hypothetical protein